MFEYPNVNIINQKTILRMDSDRELRSRGPESKMSEQQRW